MKSQLLWPRRSLGSQGFVSIMSVMIIMGILTLLTIGFSNVARRAQRNVLDNQLSTQAFYAAESGVNDAILAIRNNPVYEKTECDDADPNFTYVVNANLNVHYTCVLVDPTPGEQTFDNVPVTGVGEPILTRFTTEIAGRVIDQFDIEWDSPNGTDPIPADGFSGSNPIFESAAGWGSKVGILRIDLMADNIPNDRGTLQSNAYSFLLYPSEIGSVVAVNIGNGTANYGTVVEGDCDSSAATPRCQASVRLVNSNGPLTSDSYTARLQTYYQPVRIARMTIRSGGAVENQRNGQAVIDSTGRANDVFRRIQVRVPVISIPGIHTPFSILSGDSICKRLVAGNGAYTVNSADPACAIN